MDVNGTITGEYVTQEAIGGSDIVLTIDANLQRVAEQSLATCIENIRNGSYSQVYDAQGEFIDSSDDKFVDDYNFSLNAYYETGEKDLLKNWSQCLFILQQS